MKPIVEKLLQADRAGRIVPYLVESWEYSEDGLQLTLHVRKGVKFYDGTDLNAEAAKWNLLKSREFQGTLKLLSSVDVVDKYTVLLNMKSYGNDFLPTLAYSGGWVVSPTAYKTYGHEHAMVNPVASLCV